MRTASVLLLALAASCLPGAVPPARCAPRPRVSSASVPLARSGHVVARTRQVVGGKTQIVSAELWFTGTRSRLAVRQGSAASVVQVFDGTALYQWSEGGKAGQLLHPTGVRVLRDIVGSLLGAAPVPGRKRVGTGEVAGVACAVYRGTLKGGGASAWWKGNLDVRLWESQDPRFPYVLRSTGRDSAGNRLESEVTALGLHVRVPDGLFRPPAQMPFFAPTQVRRGRRVAGGGKPMAAPVAVYLGDPLGKGRPRAGQRAAAYRGARLALDARPLATDHDVAEVRLEPYGQGLAPLGDALVLYLKPEASSVVARAAAKARGRRLVVLVAGEVVFAPRINASWAEENNRVVILDPACVSRLARRLGKAR